MAKLHDINSQLVEDQGFLDLLKELLSDSTPMVVANAVAALAEIGDVSPTGKYLLFALETEGGKNSRLLKHTTAYVGVVCMTLPK